MDGEKRVLEGYYTKAFASLQIFKADEAPPDIHGFAFPTTG